MDFIAVGAFAMKAAEFFGFNTGAAFWYFMLFIGAFLFLYNRQTKIKDTHIAIYKELKKISNDIVALAGEQKALDARQNMQRDFVQEQESRYTFLIKRWAELTEKISGN